MLIGALPAYLYGASHRSDGKLNAALIAFIGSLIGAGTSYLGLLTQLDHSDRSAGALANALKPFSGASDTMGRRPLAKLFGESYPQQPSPQPPSAPTKSRT